MLKKITFIILLIYFSSFCTPQNQHTNRDTESIKKSKLLKKTESISSEELYKLITEKSNEYLLIDVRTKKEFKEGHIPTAINIPHTKIEENIDKIPENKLIIVYCKIGARAEVALNKLKDLGYSRIINFGGINEYKFKLEN